MKKAFMLFSIACAVALASCNNNEEQKEEDSVFSVSSPVIVDTTIYKEYVCQIRSSQHIELRALEKGYLQDIYVDEGQHVKKGQLMFKLMPMIYQAEAQKAQAEVNYSEIEFQNTKRLADSNIVSKNELAMAKARLDKSKAELAVAQASLGFTDIRAPFDGIMDRFNVRLGSLLDEGELLTSLSDNSKMWVYFNVPESEYLDYMKVSKSSQSQNVKLKLANNTLFDQNGKVETIEADFNNETGNIAFRAGFNNPMGILRHGQTGNILMPVVLKNALIIPQKATFQILNKNYVFVVDKNNVVKSRLINVQAELPHMYVVSEGLSTGDKILIDGLRKVKNDEKIKYEYVKPSEVFSELENVHAE